MCFKIAMAHLYEISTKCGGILLYVLLQQIIRRKHPDVLFF